MLPARFRYTNLDWTRGNDEDLLKAAASGVDVILGNEARTGSGEVVDVARILGDGWLVFQDTSDDAKSGSFVAIRAAALPGDAQTDWHLTKISDGRVGKDGVQARYLVDVTVVIPDQRILRLLAFHLALAASGRRDDGLDTVAGVIRGIRAAGHNFAAGADVNGPIAAVARRLGCAVSGENRWGIFYSWRLAGSLPGRVAAFVRRGGGPGLTDAPFRDVTLALGGTPPPAAGRRPRRRKPVRPRRRPRLRRPRVRRRRRRTARR